jgi:uncharacterized protein (TIGR03067 family)
MGTRPVLSLLMLLSVVCSGCSRETPLSERKRMVGVWKVVSLADNGVALPKGLRPGVDVTFTDQHFIMTDALGNQLKATYELHPGTSPKQIAFMHLAEPRSKDAESTAHQSHGIYAFEGNRLKICITSHAAPLPTDFTSGAASGRMLLVLEREK